MRSIDTCGGFVRRTRDGAYLLLHKNISTDSRLTTVGAPRTTTRPLFHLHTKVSLSARCACLSCLHYGWRSSHRVRRARERVSAFRSASGERV